MPRGRRMGRGVQCNHVGVLGAAGHRQRPGGILRRYRRRLRGGVEGAVCGRSGFDKRLARHLGGGGASAARRVHRQRGNGVRQGGPRRAAGVDARRGLHRGPGPGLEPAGRGGGVHAPGAWGGGAALGDAGHVWGQVGGASSHGPEHRQQTETFTHEPRRQWWPRQWQRCASGGYPPATAAARGGSPRARGRGGGHRTGGVRRGAGGGRGGRARSSSAALLSLHWPRACRATDHDAHDAAGRGQPRHDAARSRRKRRRHD
mmetsp:Transcript_1399/g.3165  ORF Transcript_1399/g.3165 Transcript_1399/m.3165 type:complete len:260 (+) Transcript_1399:414-1193(+)